MEEIFDTFLMLLHEMSPYLLLGFFIAGLLHSFVPESLYTRHLANNDMKSVIKAAAIGVPLPLCSCGVLPTGVSLRNNGASRASATSFLIATPQTGVDSIVATYSLLGLAFAVIRPIAALVTAMFGGFLVIKVDEKEDAETENEEHEHGEHDHCDGDCAKGVECHDDCCTPHEVPAGFWGRLAEAFRYGFFDMMKSMGKWLVVGLVVAALITAFVPNEFFARYAQYPLLNMLVVLVISVPMYVCATGSIPIALSLMLKGLSPGAALVLLMAGPAANFASILVIRRAFGSKATMAYLAAIIIGAIGFGLVVDYLLPAEWFTPHMAAQMSSCSHCASWFNVVCSVVLVASMAVAWGSMLIKRKSIKKNITTMTKEYKIKGMMCAHCQQSVEKGLGSLEGVTKVTVDLAKGVAYVDGDVDPQAVIEKIKQLGYEYEG